METQILGLRQAFNILFSLKFVKIRKLYTQSKWNTGKISFNAHFKSL